VIDPRIEIGSALYKVRAFNPDYSEETYEKVRQITKDGKFTLVKDPEVVDYLKGIVQYYRDYPNKEAQATA